MMQSLCGESLGYSTHWGTQFYKFKLCYSTSLFETTVELLKVRKFMSIWSRFLSVANILTLTANVATVYNETIMALYSRAHQTTTNEHTKTER